MFTTGEGPTEFRHLRDGQDSWLSEMPARVNVHQSQCYTVLLSLNILVLVTGKVSQQSLYVSCHPGLETKWHVMEQFGAADCIRKAGVCPRLPAGHRGS